MAQRKHIQPIERQASAQAALRLLIEQPLFLNSERVGVYLPQNNEFDCNVFIEAFWQYKKQCFLPVLDGEKLSFSAYTSNTVLKENRFNIPEPEHTSTINPEQLDLVLVPLVGFDLQGSRLGMGGGFYDRTFAFKSELEKPFLLGLAYEAQYCEEILVEEFDVPLDGVLTESRLYTFPRDV